MLKLLVEVGSGRETAQIIPVPDAQFPYAMPEVLHETVVKNPGSIPLKEMIPFPSEGVLIGEEDVGLTGRV